MSEAVGWCADCGIGVITCYMLSTANLERSSNEKLAVFLEDIINRLAAAERFKIHPIGNLDRLAEATRAAVASAAAKTNSNEGPLVNVAIGYTGREDILRAVQAVLRDPAIADLRPSEVAEKLTLDTIARNLSTAGQPDPDLIIRTSGESRTSGFLTWQAEQAELYFTNCYWPDFTKQDLLQAFASYGQRDRRFGQ
jgi:short-chain Z-isoprenyl diphosphate synthase